MQRFRVTRQFRAGLLCTALALLSVHPQFACAPHLHPGPFRDRTRYRPAPRQGPEAARWRGHALVTKLYEDFLTVESKLPNGWTLIWLFKIKMGVATLRLTPTKAEEWQNRDVRKTRASPYGERNWKGPNPLDFPISCLARCHVRR